MRKKKKDEERQVLVNYGIVMRREGDEIVLEQASNISDDLTMKQAWMFYNYMMDMATKLRKSILEQEGIQDYVEEEEDGKQ